AAVTAAHAQTFTVLYNFGGVSGDPKLPTYGPIAQGRDGNLYATTGDGGTGSRTVFKMTPAGTLTVLSNVGGEDGDRAAPGLTLGSDGNSYGATGSGGSQGAGTVFQITPRGKLTVLYSFSSDTGNGYPDAGSTQGADGNLYGTTMIGDGTFQSPISTPALHPL